MTKIDPFDSLCCGDPRSPNYIETAVPPQPRVGCYCDNCFSGKDALALEIIRLTRLHQASLKRGRELRKDIRQMDRALSYRGALQ